MGSGDFRHSHGSSGTLAKHPLLLALRARTFRSLRRHRNYRIFFTGQIVSLAGTWMQNVGTARLVIELSGSPLAIGALAFWRFVPFTVFGLVAGVVADRVESRKLVMATQACAMAISIALAIVTLTGTATLPIVYVLAALGGVALAFDAPGRQSLTFQMVGPRELPNAVALNSGLFNGSRVIGPAIAGLVIAAVGTGLCFVLNAVSFLAVLTALAIVREEELLPVVRDPSTRVIAGIRRGTRLCLERPAASSDPRRRDRRLDRRLQLPRARPTPGGGHAPRRPRGVRAPLRGVRARRARRSASDGDVPRGELATLRHRNRVLRRLRTLPRSSAQRHPRRCRPVRDRSSRSPSSPRTRTRSCSSTAPDHLRGRLIGLYLFAFLGLAPVGGLFAGWLAAVGGTPLAFAVAGSVSLATIAVAQVRRPAPLARTAVVTE